MSSGEDLKKKRVLRCKNHVSILPVTSVAHVILNLKWVMSSSWFHLNSPPAPTMRKHKALCEVTDDIFVRGS